VRESRLICGKQDKKINKIISLTIPAVSDSHVGRGEDVNKQDKK